MEKYMYCPACGSRLYFISFYVMSKKYVAFADGSTGTKSVETELPSTINESYYKCDHCNSTYDYIGLGQFNLRN